MDFLKKHYEKMLLGLVLAGLVGALVFMPFYISSDNAARAALLDTVIHPTVKELADLDMTRETAVAERLHASYSLDLESSNRVFNPMEWQKNLDGYLVPVATHVGLRMVVVYNITPLYFILTLDSVSTNELGARYVIGVERQADDNPSKRRKQQRYVSVGDKANDAFALVQVKGAPDNPDELVLKLVDTGELVSISRDKSFRRVDAYAADFRYDPEKKNFRGRRTGDRVAFNGTDYIVSDVTKNELILQDQSNLKKTPLPLTP